MYNFTIEPNFNPDLLEENVEYNFDIIVEEKQLSENGTFCIPIEEKTVANGYFSFCGIDLTYVIMHCDLDYMEQAYAYVEDYMTYIVESINE